MSHQGANPGAEGILKALESLSQENNTHNLLSCH